MALSGVLDPPSGTAPVLPRLAPGTELLGQYQDSAYENPRFLIRRADGQVMQLPRLLYRVAGSLDGRDADQVAADLTVEFGQELTADQVVYLVEDRLRPVGVLATEATDASLEAAPEPPVRADPLLGLRFRAAVVPAGVAWRIGGFFRLLFPRPVWVALLVAFLTVDGWIIAQGDPIGRLVSGVEHVARHPGLILALLGLTIVFTAFHECGHVTACRYGGARPGNLGVGLYLVWPAFYSTVTDSYRLDRVGRLRTDLGGVYFNTIAMMALGLCYLGTGTEWLLLGLVTMHVQTAWQFLPNLRFDGYYILADLVGVPDLFGFIRPAVLSLLPGRPTHPLVRQLKPRARRVILTWVALVVPTLLAWLVVFLLAAPRLLPAAWRASLEYVQHLDAAARAGDVVSTLLGVSQLFLLALPWIGIALVVWSTVALLARRPVVRWAVALGAQRRAILRRRAGLAALAGLGGLLVLRIARVAGSHPAGAGELRVVESAVAALHGTAGPPIDPGDWLMRAQLIAYAELTGAFERHDSIVAAGREPAVVASAVLVAALLVLTLRRRVRPFVAALPLVALLVMGPAVTVLVTAGSGVVGAAWAAVGALVLVAARRSVLAVVGLALVVVGVATAPSVIVPVAVGIGVLGHTGRHSRREATRPRHAPHPRHARRAGRWRALLRRLAGPAVLFVVVLSVVLSGGTGAASLDPAERTVLLLLVALVVTAAWPVRRLRRAAAAVAGLTLVAVLPWAGAGQALVTAVLAGALLGALLVVAWTSGPVQQRPHPLLRIAVALPVMVLVVAGALFLPSAGRVPPHGQLAAWIAGPGSSGGTVAVPAGLWGDLLQDGVQPGRLVRVPRDTQQPTDWVVTVGESTTGARPVATFGAGPAALTVRPGAAGHEQESATEDEAA